MIGRYRDAVAAYVRGHDRVWEIERKRGVTAGSGADRLDGPTIDGASARGDEIEWTAPPPRARVGVGVATDLEFHRGPGNRAAESDPSGDSSHG